MRLAKLRIVVKCSSPSAVPQVATARGRPAWKKAITSVYPSQTMISLASMIPFLAQLSP